MPELAAHETLNVMWASILVHSGSQCLSVDLPSSACRGLILRHAGCDHRREGRVQCVSRGLSRTHGPRRTGFGKLSVFIF